MSPQEIEKLLGGYATDTLTAEERRTLFAAALGNQALFDALADEEALRDLLQDPASRAHLLGALREERVSPMARMVAWLRRPSVLALASAVAAGIVVIAVVGPGKLKKAAPAEVAMSRAPEAARPQPAPAPLASPKEEPRPIRSAKPAKREEPERDMPAAQPAAQNSPPPPPPAAAPPPVQAVAPMPPPPAPLASAAEANQVAQSKVADAAQPAASAGYRTELKKEAAIANARDLYYAPPPAVVSGFLDTTRNARTANKRQSAGGALSGTVGGVAGGAVARVPGVRYSILRRVADGTFAEVDPGAVFAPGDALRVRFEANQEGSLAVMERQSGGIWTLRMAARTREGEPVHMPAESALRIAAPGELRFFVRFSRTLQPQSRLSQVTATPGLLRDKVANSVYVVNPARAADAAVEFEVTIVAK